MSARSIWLVRHAESVEDIDPSMHGDIDDLKISLTSRGREQSREIGYRLAQDMSTSDPLWVFLSPSRRARETWSEIRKHTHDPHCVFVDGRIRNLNWGLTNKYNRHLIEADRYRVGVLNFQFPGGDHTPTYVSNIEAFVRETAAKVKKTPNAQLMIISHGFALRIIVKTLVGLSAEEFRWLSNPPNAFVAKLKWSDSAPFATLLTPLPKTEKVTVV